MYAGSMIGSGSVVFAVWGYVIANMKPDEKVGAQVELNPKLLGFILGEKEEVVTVAITKLCSPDDRSRTKDEDGKKLIRLGEYDYQVVNGAKYAAIRDEEERRAYNREAKRRERDKGNKARSKLLPGELTAVRLVENGATQGEQDRHSDSMMG